MKHLIKIRKKISSKLFFRKIRSRLKKKISRGSKLTSTIRKKYSLTNLHQFKEKPPVKSAAKWIDIAIPEIFCLIDNHNATMKFLNELNDKLSYKHACNIRFDHRQTKRIGLAASILFDKKIKKHQIYWRKKRVAISYKGYLSDSYEVNNFLLAFGLLNELNVDTKNIESNEVDKDYKSKYVTFKFNGSSRYVYMCNNAATDLVNYFRKCFKYNKLDLTEEAIGRLTDAFGEILGNAQEHAGNSIVEWYVLGFYDKSTSYCSFAIINFGQSIYESLSSTQSTANEAVKQIERIVESHKNIYEKSMKLFTIDATEPIWNVMALQDGISSKRTIKGQANTRGQGLMDVLEFIKFVTSADDPIYVVIISGRSKILVDFAYPIIRRKVGKNSEERRYIIFNSEQNLHFIPDENKVILMKEKFTGTIISGKFKIDKQYLISKIKK